MNLWKALDEAVAAGTLRDLDRYLARQLARDDHPVALAAALVSQATGDGHVCLDLAALAGRRVLAGGEFGGIAAPALADWRTALSASPVVGAAEGEQGAFAPLILDAADRLYLGRYFAFEQAILAAVRERLTDADDVDEARLAAGLARLFPDTEAPVGAGLPAMAPSPGTTGVVAADTVPNAAPQPDRQKFAAALAALRRLAVITGGPGTGKTTTVTRLLAALTEAMAAPPRIALAAPTGKAAARLTESVRAARQYLARDGVAGLDAIPDQATTLHRLLGAVPGRVGFRHDAANPLHLDLLVVDEASMVDVPLMARLLAALPPRARLILLGDRDQLASVEAGSVLGDLCRQGGAVTVSDGLRARLESLGVAVPAAEPGAAIGGMADSVAVLTVSRRFGPDSGIGNAARAVNRGEADAALELLCADAFPDALWRRVDQASVEAAVGKAAVDHYRAALTAADPAAALEAFGRFRLLCALRDGPFGVAQVNAYAERALAKAGLIRPGDERFYPGRPILVTRNDYALRLFNGDIGLCLPDPASDGRLRAFFPDEEGGVRKVLLNRLPVHETVYAMTVHKSQGSEFERCVVVLPDADAAVLTRELVYTGITRARSAVAVWGTESVFVEAVSRRVERRSGLRDALWQS